MFVWLCVIKLMRFVNSGNVLEKVAEYFYYVHKNRNREDVQDLEIPVDMCLELLMAADFLDCEFELLRRLAL